MSNFSLNKGEDIVKTLLLLPPQADPTLPGLGLSVLVGYLRGKGYLETYQRDLNLAAFDYFLDRERLYPYCQQIIQEIEQLEQRETLEEDAVARLKELYYCATISENILAEVNDAKKWLKANPIKEFPQYMQNYKVLELAFRILSAANAPYQFTFGVYEGPYSCWNSDQVKEAIDNYQQDLFYKFYCQNILPELVETRPEVVGISLCNFNQLIPGFVLAKVVKEALPGCHLVIGGGIVTELKEIFLELNFGAGLVDSYVIYEGEEALCGLLEHLEGKREKKDIPNLMYFEADKLRATPMRQLPMNQMATPDFTDLKMTEYYTGQVIVPVLLSKGCYWSNCMFCDHYYSYGKEYRTREVKTIIEEIKYLKDRYQTDCFFFVDEALPMKLLKDICTALIEENVGIKWGAEIRSEQEIAELAPLLKEAGCVALAFGIETFSDRLLELMKKGVKRDWIMNNLEALAQVGIGTHLMLVAGYPTETQKELQQTIDFLMNKKELYTSFVFTHFILMKQAPIIKEIDQYPIKMLENADQFKVFCDYLREDGMSNEQLKDMVKKFNLRVWSRLDIPRFRTHLAMYCAARPIQELNRFRAEAKPEKFAELPEDAVIKFDESVVKRPLKALPGKVNPTIKLYQPRTQKVLDIESPEFVALLEKGTPLGDLKGISNTTDLFKTLSLLDDYGFIKIC